MSFFISKILILISCVCLSILNINDGSAPDILTIIALLAAIILSNFISLILDENESERQNIYADLTIAFYAAICFNSPEFAVFIPIIAFEIYTYRLVISGITGVLAISSVAFTEPVCAIFILMLCVISALSSYMYSKNVALSEKLYALRDGAKERELLMTENAQHIIDNQNAEIYNATLQERNRIARDIHDNVGHMLTRSILQVGSIKILNKDDSLSGHLDSLHETLNTAMTSMRNSVHDLYDESVDMKSSIDRIVEDINGCSTQEHPLTCSLNFDCGRVVPKDIKYAFIAIVREAVNNTRKHSNADKISISVIENPGFYKLIITDNGTNIGNIEDSSGIGLKNIQDRIKNIGGTSNIDTSNGFKIMVTAMKHD